MYCCIPLASLVFSADLFYGWILQKRYRILHSSQKISEDKFQISFIWNINSCAFLCEQVYSVTNLESHILRNIYQSSEIHFWCSKLTSTIGLFARYWRFRKAIAYFLKNMSTYICVCDNIYRQMHVCICVHKSTVFLC